MITSLRQEINTLKQQLEVSPVDMTELAKEIMNNFEEHWELKNSIKEITRLNEQNILEISHLKKSSSGASKARTLARKIALCQESIHAN